MSEHNRALQQASRVLTRIVCWDRPRCPVPSIPASLQSSRDFATTSSMQSMSDFGSLQARLSGPLREHLLQQLPARGLAQLRACNRAFRAFVDTGTGASWREAAKQLMPAETIPVADDSHAVQQRLRDQAAAFKRITSGDESCVAHQELEMESCSPDSWSWAPCDPSDGRSHYLLAGSTIISQGSGCRSEAGVCVLPKGNMAGDDHQAGYECPGQSAYVLHLTNGQTSVFVLSGSTPHLAVPFKSVMWSPDGMRLAAQRGWLLTVLNFSQQGPTARSNPERAELLAAVGRRPREGLSTRFENLQN
ncbi:hypothetical protein WJX84_009519 [Apatococcus fuscideae]|uniref:F-box domain-containing protein n=1 Tax=Apatococcus fuscideae TaxID=2026836 RepID=A0AAW1T6U9_9CHLO